MKRKESREIVLRFRVNTEEYEIIKDRYIMSKCNGMSEFFRQIIMNGLLIECDEKFMNEQTKIMHSISNNINQIAMRVNSTNRVYAEDIENLKKSVNKIWQQQAYIQSSLTTLKR